MNLTEAIAHANALTFPGFMQDDASLSADRQANEEALSLLISEWKAAEKGQEPVPFSTIQALADRNRDTCDLFGPMRLLETRPRTLQQHLSDDDLIRGVAALQHRKPTVVAKEAGAGLSELNIAYLAAPVSGMICGIDIETTGRDPSRGYIINVGLEFMRMDPSASPQDAFSAYCGLPDLYESIGVPLANIHHITWEDVNHKTPFRANKSMQKALLSIMCRYPYMAHNAAFEDSWFMLHIDGYAEARKAGRIIPIDTRDICRRCDPETKMLPHESRPAALESWARRRGTLQADENETHLGLEDVDLMFRTVQAEFVARNMFEA